MSLTIAMFMPLNTTVTMCVGLHVQCCLTSVHLTVMCNILSPSSQIMYEMLSSKHCRSHHLQVCSHYTCLWNITFEGVKILYFMTEHF
jgi:hypothetical protein